MGIKTAEDNELEVVGVIPVGIPALDDLLCSVGGSSGLPRRRIVEITGDFSLGKTSLCVMAVKQAQEMGLKCLWVDAEYAWSNEWAKTLGLDLKKLDILHERIAETALDVIEEKVADGTYKCVVIDSIPALLPREDAEKTNDGKVMATQARMVSRFSRKIRGIAAENNVLILVINADSTNMATMKLECRGGQQLAKDKSIWLRLTNAQKPIKKGEDIIGKTVQVEIRKNKLKATERQKVNLELIFGQGFLTEKREVKRGRPSNKSTV